MKKINLCGCGCRIHTCRISLMDSATMLFRCSTHFYSYSPWIGHPYNFNAAQSVFVSAEIYRKADDQKTPRYSTATKIFSAFSEETVAELLQRTNTLARSLSPFWCSISLFFTGDMEYYRKGKERFCIQVTIVVKSNATLLD